LRRGVTIRENGVTSMWTGLLVKPSHGLWLLTTGSYNQRSKVNPRDSVVASSQGYAPPAFEFELDSPMKDTMWLDAELATLLPVQPGVRYARSTIQQRPRVVHIAGPDVNTIETFTHIFGPEGPMPAKTHGEELLSVWKERYG
jgi:hypothetical protein